MKTSVIRRLPVLGGIAIIGVVLNHAASWGHYAMFLWADRYRPVTAPNWDQIGSLPYYILFVLKQLPIFAVPAFIFIAGYFIAYSVQGDEKKVRWKVVKARLTYLIIPYLIWSILVFIRDFILSGTLQTPLSYLVTLLTGGAVGIYYFVPLLCLLYLFSPILVYLAKANFKLLLISTIILQFGLVVFNNFSYSKYLNLVDGNNPILDQLWVYNPSWSPAWHVFYFVLGIGLGLYLPTFTKYLNRYQPILFIVLPLAAILNIIESDFLLRVTLNHWGAYLGRLSYHIYATAFILFFLSLETIPNSKVLSYVNGKSYGIFLTHVIVIGTVAKIIYNFLPGFLAYAIIITIILFILGLALPLILMEVVRKSPARRSYRYLFG